MGIESSPKLPFSDVLRHIDSLLDEAAVLRERITAALHRENAPFFPERRHTFLPYEPERRMRDRQL